MKLLFLPAALMVFLLLLTSCSTVNTTTETNSVDKNTQEPVPKVYTSVLWLGDSQSVETGGLGDTLFKASKIASVPFSWVARCSARPSQLANGYKSSCGSKTIPASLGVTPKVGDLLQAKTYDLVVIQAAGNLLGYNKTFVVKDIHTLLDAIPTSIPCLWVGLSERVGTSTLDETKLNDTLRDTVSPRCTYVDILGLGAYPRNSQGKALKGDGTHLNASYGEPFKFLLSKYSEAFNDSL